MYVNYTEHQEVSQLTIATATVAINKHRHGFTQPHEKKSCRRSALWQGKQGSLAKVGRERIALLTGYDNDQQNNLGIFWSFE